MAAKSRYFWYLYSALCLIVLIRIIPFLYPESRTWGFNHLIFLPPGFAVGFFTIAAVALILPFVKKSEIYGEKIINWFSLIFFESPRKYLYRVIFISLMGVLFILFAAPTHFLGDGYAILNNIASDSNTLYKWSEVGIIFLLKSIRMLLGPANMQTAKLTINVVSFISGIISLWFYFGIARYGSESNVKRILILLALIFSGSSLMFFGYAEHYPLLMIFVSGMFYFGLRYIKYGKGAALLILFLLSGIVLHLQMAVFIPAVAYICIFPNLYGKERQPFRRTILAIIIVGILGIITLFIYKITTDLYFQAMFLGFLSDHIEGADYTVFSFAHIVDIINQSLLLAPMLIVYLIGFRKNHSFFKNNERTKLLILASVGSLAFILFIDPSLGMARDWDLFAFSFFSAIILSIVVLSNQAIDLIKKIFLSILLIQIISPLPFLLTNLIEEESAEYAEYIISQDIDRSLGTLYILHEYYEENGYTENIKKMRQLYRDRFARRHKCDSVITALKRGDVNTATPILSRIKPNKYDPHYQKIMGRYYYLLKDYDKSLEYINRLLQLRRYRADNYGDRAKIYIARGEFDKALDDLRYGYNLTDTSKYILDGLANTYFMLKQYDSTIFYAKARLAIDSTNPNYYYMLVKSYVSQNNIIMAKKYFEKYAEFNIDYSKYREKLTELSELIQKMKSEN